MGNELCERPLGDYEGSMRLFIANTQTVSEIVRSTHTGDV